MTITVTQQHIDKGVRRVSCGCPVSLALEDILHRQILVASTDGSYFACLSSSSHQHVHLPEEVGHWINDYDAGKPVSPFSFEVSL